MTEDRDRAEPTQSERIATRIMDLYETRQSANYDAPAFREIVDLVEAARCEERTRTDAAVAAAEVVMEASRKKGLRLEALERALREISQLPLGDHRAQKIARTALERGDSHVQDQVPAIEGMYVSDRYDEQQLAFHVEGLRASKK